MKTTTTTGVTIALAATIAITAAATLLPVRAAEAPAPAPTAPASNSPSPASLPIPSAATDSKLTQVFASPDFAPSAVAVSGKGRIFVEFPRFVDQAGNPSVAEVFPDGTMKPYPGKGWNDWAKDKPVAQSFVSTNTLNIFPADPEALWVMDTGAPFLGKNLEDAAKVVRIDLKTDTVARVYPLPRSVLPENGYPNDLRLSPDAATAYITESGTGAILLLDLKTGDVRRVLSDTPLTKASPNRVPHADGIELLLKDSGKPFRVHADALEISPDGSRLYFTTVDGPLYRVDTSCLHDKKLSAKELELKVEVVMEDFPTVGGTAMDSYGNLYLSDTNLNAIRILHHGRTSRPQMLLEDKRLIWPDAIFLAPDGYLYVCAAQINRLPLFAGALPQQKPFCVYKYPLPKP